MSIPSHMAKVAGRLRTKNFDKAPRRLVFNNRTSASIIFGVDGLLYARRCKTGKWYYAEDVGVWMPISGIPQGPGRPYKLSPNEDDLERMYHTWLRTASKAELKAADPMKEYRVVIRHYTHTKMQREQLQEQHEVTVLAPIHRPKLAAIAAGFPKTGKTKGTGSYSNEVTMRQMDERQPGWTKRNWTEWHVITQG